MLKVLWFTWKDLKHPQAGGAELINEEIAKRLVRDGYEVVLVVGGFAGGEAEEVRNGYKIIRLGNRYTVYWCAYQYYKKYLRGWANLVIDEMNTIPFFCKYYVKERNVLLAYQLCREIWFYQMFFPLSLIGYMVEPIYLRLLCDRYIITESESAKQDMLHYGFSEDKVSVIPIGITTQPVENLDELNKFQQPTLLSLGAIRAMKRTLDQISAFEIAKKQIPNLQLKIAGSISDSYGEEVFRRIVASDYAQDIEYLGCVDESIKIELMRKSHFILVTSIKEGWGLIVTEANSQGTPAVVYNVDGLRDSVKERETGLITKKNTPEELARVVIEGLTNFDIYKQLRKNAWLWSKSLTLEHCYREFLRVSGL